MKTDDHSQVKIVGDPDDVDHEVASAGVTSCVLDAAGNRLGHVVLLDYDDLDLGQVRQRVTDLPDPSVIIESSPGRYHVWVPVIHSWDEAIELAEGSGCDPEYVSWIEEKEEMFLRCARKVALDDESIRATAPTVIESVGGSDADAAVSGPHLKHIAELCSEGFGPGDCEKLIDDIIDDNDIVGAAAPTEKYVYGISKDRKETRYDDEGVDS